MNDLPLIDTAQMDRLNEWGGKELRTKMVDLFLTHARDRMDQISEGLSTSQAGMAETGAHTLKSSAGNVGAQRVQRLAQEAETLAEEGNMEGLQSLLPSLEQEFDAACVALRELIEEGVK
jgi:two-component system sensor histidine kinase/response regulator